MEQPVTIIGAGMGGLTLASLLYKNGIDATIYELETSPNTRFEGSILDMHEESGQYALRKAGLFDAFRKNIIPNGDALRILDKSGSVLLEENGNGLRPEIDRGGLRNILIQSLPTDMIHWGSKVAKVAKGKDGGYDVTFGNRETLTSSLLVEADGAWSKVRPLVSDSQPIYLGVSFAGTHLFDVDTHHPESAALAGSGSMIALSEEKGLLTHRDGKGQINVHVAIKTPQPWSLTSRINFSDTEAVRAWLLNQFSGWHEKLLALISESDTGFHPFGIYALPVGHSWNHIPGVTLLGDAAHLMSPFAGEGANLAMLDGADLADAILANPQNVEAALTSYEAKCFPRAKSASAESAENLGIAFRSDAPKGMVDLMSGGMKPN